MTRFARSFLCIAIIVAGLSGSLLAGCNGATVPAARVAALRPLLAGSKDGMEFHVYSDVLSADGRLHYLLYLLDASPSTAGSHTVYFAATQARDSETVLFTHDVSAYLPDFAQTTQPVKLLRGARTLIPTDPKIGPVTIDGCIDAFVIQPNIPGVHLNLFAKASSIKVEAANDVVLVLLGRDFAQPALELGDTSRYEVIGKNKHRHRDSIMAVLPTRDAVTELVWQFFTQETGGILEPSLIQNRLYRWEARGFRAVGTLEPEELAERMKNGVILTRSDAITTLRLEYKVPGPNQPAP